MTKKKYLILFTIIIVLLVAVLIINNMPDKNSINEQMVEKSSDSFGTTEDIIVADINQEEPIQASFARESSLKIGRLTLFSPDFQNLELIPAKFTCDGDNINPNLEISGVDEKAKSLVLIMDDPDAPNGTWDHWIKFNIPANTRNINAGEELKGISGKGTGGNLDYAGPCPPNGKHNYIFKLYALDTELTLSEGSSKSDVEKAMEGHILQQVELIGVYQRKLDLVEEKVEVTE